MKFEAIKWYVLSYLEAKLFAGLGAKILKRQQRFLKMEWWCIAVEDIGEGEGHAVPGRLSARQHKQKRSMEKSRLTCTIWQVSEMCTKIGGVQ